MKKTIFVGLLLLLAIGVFSAGFNPKYTVKKFYERNFPEVDYTFNPDMSPVKYGYGDWSEELNLGNHRAKVKVDTASPAVLAHIEWRRFDKEPQEKKVIVKDANGNTVNSKAFTIKNLYGDVVFEAKEPGNYYIYYMPYEVPKTYAYSKTLYLRNVCEASEEWLNANNLLGDTFPSDLPQAELVEIQSRTLRGIDSIPDNSDVDKNSFNSMYPMLIIITEEEKAEFDTKNQDKDFLLFCEDRTNSIKMFDQIPYKWFKSGEVKDFEGFAQPGEIYPFQVGVYALKDLKNVKINITGFEGIKVHSLNTEGINPKGEYFTKNIDIDKGMVQPLWFYLTVSKDAKEITGKIGISFDNAPETVADIDIKVEGDFLEDGGVSNTWRMSRISWFDSTLGLDDTVVSPYKPIKWTGSKASILNRTIDFNDFGFPRQITSYDNKILTNPIEFNVYEKGNKLTLKPKSKRVVKEGNSAWTNEYVFGNDRVEVTVVAELKCIGQIDYSVKLKALKDIDLSDIKLSAPISESCAKYMLGLGYRGERSPEKWNWEWNYLCDHYLWIGEVDAGILFKLKLQDDYFFFQGIIPDDKVPEGWCNDNKGGAEVAHNGKTYDFVAYSGEKSFKAGQTCNYDFRIMVTPFHDYDMENGDMRYGFCTLPHTNFFNVFQADRTNPFINYPFRTDEYMVNWIKGDGKEPDNEYGKIMYDGADIKDINDNKGSITMWVTAPYDLGYMFRDFFCQVSFGNNHIQVGEYKGIINSIFCSGDQWTRRTVFERRGSSATGWKAGEKHIITLTWENGNSKLYVDGNLVLDCQIPWKLTGSDITQIELYGCMLFDALRLDRDINLSQEKVKGADTVFLDTYETKGNDYIDGVRRNEVPGLIYAEDYDKVKETEFNRKTMPSIYYRVGELSAYAEEIYMMLSMNGEVVDTKSVIFDANGAKVNKVLGGGYQWLNEHLQTGYVPAWHTGIGGGWNEKDHDFAVGVRQDGRLANFYIAGLEYLIGLMDKSKRGGTYLDGIGMPGELMERAAKVYTKHWGYFNMYSQAPNDYDYENWRGNFFATKLDCVPYLSYTWPGEGIPINLGEGYYMTNIAGMPFGIHCEMLEYTTGGNRYKLMLYCMTSRELSGYTDMYTYWDLVGIPQSKIIGYWDRKPVAKTGDDKIFATAYKCKDRTVIAVASWHKQDKEIKLDIDWKALGINKAKAKVSKPFIPYFQWAEDDVDLNNLTVPADGGFIIEIK